MKPQVVLSISDLHLGSGNNQDSFTKNTTAVENFGRELAAAARDKVADITLVLNGDTFDLWEIVSPEELQRGPDAYAAIGVGLNVPTSSPSEVMRLAGSVGKKIETALTAHPDFEGLLRDLISAGVFVHFNVGNHDHQLDNDLTADALKDVLIRRGVAQHPNEIAVDRYYLNRVAGFYAEHGDQFAGAESKSPLHDRAGNVLAEAGGFYFLRYVWNRLEADGYGDLQHLSIVKVLIKFFAWIIHKNGPVEDALFYASDYFQAVHEKRALLVPHLRPLYRAWEDSTARRTRAAGRALTLEDLEPYRDDIKAAAPKEILEPSDRSAAPVPEPGMVMPGGFDLSWLPGSTYLPQISRYDEYFKGVESRFRTEQKPFPKLDTAAIRTVTLGHTHRECRRVFSAMGPHFLNSGSWTRDHPIVYVWGYGDGTTVDQGMRGL